MRVDVVLETNMVSIFESQIKLNRWKRTENHQRFTSVSSSCEFADNFSTSTPPPSLNRRNDMHAFLVLLSRFQTSRILIINFLVIISIINCYQVSWFIELYVLSNARYVSIYDFSFQGSNGCSFQDVRYCIEKIILAIYIKLFLAIHQW